MSEDSLYLIHSMRFRKEGYDIEKSLQELGFVVNNPSHSDKGLDLFPASVRRRLIQQRNMDLIHQSHFAVLILDHFGPECGFEAGYMCSQAKPVYGVFLDGTATKSFENFGYNEYIDRVYTSPMSLVQELRTTPSVVKQDIRMKHLSSFAEGEWCAS